MKCGKCTKTMKEKYEILLGERIKTFECSCGNKLISLKEATALQQKILPKIHTTRKIIGIGNSLAVTLPKQLSIVFREGESVDMIFEPKNTEIRIKPKM